MPDTQNPEKGSVYRRFHEEILKSPFVRVVCTAREVKHFAALSVILFVLEKELKKHEVLWSPPPLAQQGFFEVLIGDGYEVSRGAVISEVPKKVSPQALLLYSPSVATLLHALCKELGYVSSETLWPICICTAGSSGRELDAERVIKRRRAGREPAEEEEETSRESEDFSDSDSAGGVTAQHQDICAEIEKFRKFHGDKERLELKKEIYFPFCRWATLYGALLNDLGVAKELELFNPKKKRRACVLDGSEYVLNQFLAQIGISVAAAQSASLGTLTGQIGEFVRRSFRRRRVYVKHYEHNVEVTHIEAYFSICSLIRRKKYVEAVFGLRDIKKLEIAEGMQEHRRMVEQVKRGAGRKKIVRVHGAEVVYVPKDVLVFRTLNEISVIKEVFSGIRGVVRRRHPEKEVVVSAYAEEEETWVLVYGVEERIEHEKSGGSKVAESLRSIVKEKLMLRE